MRQKTLALILILVGVAGMSIAGFLYVQPISPEPQPTEPVAVPTPEPTPFTSEQVIGQSVEGRDIRAITYGDADPGDEHILLVGGIHGGYEWNSVLLAYEFMDYVAANEAWVPEDVTLTVIPNLNPDGLYAVLGTTSRFTIDDVPNPETRVAAGRFNANEVDLNRNFDCNWAPESTWRGQTVSAGTGPFSEPEAAALRDFVFELEPDMAIFWHSRANNVYASECNNDPLPQTLAIMETYADAAGYGAVPSFDAYPITGDVEGWLASLGIPAVTVELETANTTEFERNRAGVDAVMTKYSQTKQ